MNQEGKFKRHLKARHLIMMTLGGTIGTGLLLASGSALHDAGPAGAILGYVLVALIVYFLMQSLGEMAAHSPVTGSFCEYCSKYVDKSFGFAMSWNYYFNWVFVIASELIASAFIMQYWFPNTHTWLWTLIFFILIFVINLVAVKVYGEVEYWVSFIKIATIIIFIVVGVLIIFGLVGSNAPVGFKNLTLADGPFHAGLFGFFSVFLVAGYSFQGTELIGIAAGEADNPSKNIPKAIKSVFWRIMLFYILAMAIIAILVPFTSSWLVNPNSTVASSPFTMVFSQAGIKYVAGVMNFIVLSAILSAANASMYTASRILWHMGKEKEAPKSLQGISKNGVPLKAVILTAVVSFVLIAVSSYHSGLIFTWLINMVSLAGYIAWFGICLSHYRFRKAFGAQKKNLEILTFKAKFFPFAPLFAMALIAIIMVGQEVMELIKHDATWSGFFATYGGVILFFLAMLIYKISKKTKVIPLKEIDLKKLS